MDPLVATLILILLALLGARFSFSTERVPPGPRLLFRTGTHFLVLGFALGPAGLGLLGHEATRQLFPFLAVGLGWIGLHFGLQLDRHVLARFPVSHHVLCVGQALLAFGIFLAGAWGILHLAGVRGEGVPLLLLGAAATAAVTTPAGIALVSSNFMVRGNVRDLLLFIGSLDAIVGIVALQVTYSLFRRETIAAGVGAVAQPALVGVALGLGLVCGIVFLWLTRLRPAGEELVLFLLGMCAFAAGAALRWGLSPLFVSLTAGAVVANFGHAQDRVRRVLERWEKPVYVIFLLLAGALLRMPDLSIVALAVGYAVLRGGAKVAATGALTAVVPLGFKVPRSLGLGLLPQGGISLAMAASVVLVYSGLELPHAGAEATLFTVIVLGVMMSELAGPFLTARVLRQAGEISPHAERALAEGDERRAEREAIKHGSGPGDSRRREP